MDSSYGSYTIRAYGLITVFLGVLLFAAASGLIIYQTTLEEIYNAYATETLALVVISTHFACALLVLLESVIGSLGGKHPLFSFFLISCGSIATLTQAVLVAVVAADDYVFRWALSTLAVQCTANGLLFAILFADIAHIRTNMLVA